MGREQSIPRKDVDFNVAQEIIVNTVSEHMLDWGIDKNWFSNLIVKKSEWDMAWRAYENPKTRTPEITFIKTEKRKEYEKPLRILVKNLQSNVHVMPEDLVAMGIALPNPSRTPAPVAHEAPDVDTDTSVLAHVGIHFFEKGHKHKKAKPAGQHAVEIAWIISDTLPTRWDELLHSVVGTRTPYTFSFDYKQRGQTLYFAIRWENTRGEKGPWSAIQSTVIP
jgi:hypothetical protein